MRPLSSETPSSSTQQLPTPFSSTINTTTPSSIFIKNFNSLYDPTLTSDDINDNDKDNSSCCAWDSNATNIPIEAEVATAFASLRFFSSPGRSNSIMGSVAAAAAAATNHHRHNHHHHQLFDNSVAVPTYSLDPYLDFRWLMQEMVEALPELREIGSSSATPITQSWPSIKLTKSVVPAETHQRSSLVDLLKVCEEWGLLRETKSIHGYVLKSNFADQDCLVLLNHVAHVYSKCMDYDSARKVFDGMSERNVFSWTVMMVASNEHGYCFDGMELFCMMLDQGVLPDGFALSAVLQSCVGLGSIELGEMVHAQVVVRGFLTHTVVSTSLLNLYAKLGKIECSSKVFNTMTEHNNVSWNAMISGYTSNGLHLHAFNCFIKMVESGFKPNNFTFISVSKAVGQFGDINKCHEIYKFASKWGLDSNTVVGTALIDMYAKCGSLADARLLFDSKFKFCQVSTPWNAMLTGYSQSGSHQEALELFTRMCPSDVEPDIYTFCSVFNSIAALKCLKFLRETHGMAWKCGYDVVKISTLNALSDAYAKCGSLEAVEKVFDRMEEKDIVSWTTMVTAYCQYSEWEKALIIFSQMREEGYTPNNFTFSSVITACAGLCLLEYGQQIHGLICKANLDTEDCIESALIDMYAKCGNLIDAKKVFERLSNPDTITWTSIISAYAQHGLVEDALQLFRKMIQFGAKPNSVTFLCVLFACSHGGMIEEGLNIFHLMEDKYGMVPEMEHYTCVVDLLGRVGRLNDAMEFIGRMPIEPNEMIWQTLLGACRIHGNTELGEIAAQNILSTKPECPASYVLLSNTYIESGLYEDGFSLRDVMKERGVKKEPGYSWISVRGEVHKFYAGDEQHPQKDEIYTIFSDMSASGFALCDKSSKMAKTEVRLSVDKIDFD
ncbi:pentatricopeptide repeat-containing protein [Senna tora]|uniref:Pentatricopeptide repeat-containing protein n=1 Tax=Senna tora TaxID=362788 RepID=A0A834TPI0_9FABA|nr:pentatricopeptide repeat-containing protein [Senna tora]